MTQIGAHISIREKRARVGVAFVFALCFLVFFAAAAFALEIEAHVNQRRINFNQSLTLTITVSGDSMSGLPDPEIETLGNFSVYNQTSNSSVQIINLNVSATKTVTYTLMPSKKGRTKIGPFTAKTRRETAKAPAIQIDIVASGRPVSPKGAGDPEKKQPDDSRDPVFVTEVTPKEPYVGQQTIARFRLYRPKRRDISAVDLPEFDGFWTEELQDRKQLLQAHGYLDGVRTYAYEQRVALFPTTSGPKTIGAARVQFSDSLSGLSDDPWGFSGRRKSRRRTVLQSEPVTINVRPLPEEGRPDSFMGAVGKYEMTAMFDHTTVKAGDAVNLIVIVSGVGYIKGITEPIVPEIPGLKRYKAQREDSVEVQGESSAIGGAAKFTFLLVPEKEGRLDMPPVKFSCFNPETRRYKELASEPLSLNVRPGEVGNQHQPLTVALGDEVRLIQGDIRHIKKSLGVYTRGSRQFHEDRLFWIAMIAPILLFLLLIPVATHLKRLDEDTAYRRRRRSRKILETHLARAEQSIDADADAFIVDIYRAITDFIGDHLNVPSPGMTPSAAADYIGKAGADDKLAEKALDLLERCDHGRYSGTSWDLETRKSILSETETLILRLQEQLKK